MGNTFLTKIKINNVRHLKNIEIPLDENARKNLILTGKNGSGKTSVLEALADHFEYIFSPAFNTFEKIKYNCKVWNNEIQRSKSFLQTEQKNIKMEELHKSLKYSENQLKHWTEGAVGEYTSLAMLREKYSQGRFIVAYYGAEREYQATQYKNIKKVDFQDNYGLKDNPGKELTKYLVDLKATQAFTKSKEKKNNIEKWFINFELLLKRVFEDDDLTLEFNDETFQFSICAMNREPFDFNTMSSGYSAIFYIVNDLIMRMEAQSSLRCTFDSEGIVLIDEIEAHLHLDLQKKIMDILTVMFPNLQFIVTTYSPFILSAAKNTVIYDLEKKILVKNGMTNLPYEGIVESYFNVDTLSEELRDKFNEYKELTSKTELTDSEYEKLDKLEYYLDEMPDYLAPGLTAEYERLKLEFSNREE